MNRRRIALVVAVVVLLGAGGVVAWARSRPADPPPNCDLAVLASGSELAPRGMPPPVRDIPESVGTPGSVVEIGQWDPTVDWTFRRESTFPATEPEPFVVVEEGAFRAHVALDFTRTDLHPSRHDRHRTVIFGRTFWWEEASSQVRRGGCAVPDDREPRNPLGQHAIIRRSMAEGRPFVSTQPTLDAGTRLPVGPGTPTTVDGEPGTAYVWISKEAPWLKVEFTLDGRSQLRAARATDRELGTEYLDLWARPAPGALIADPSDQPIVAPP